MHMAFFDHQRLHSAMSFKASWRGLLVDVAHSRWLVVVCCQRPILFFFLLSFSSTRVLCNVFFLNFGPYFVFSIFSFVSFLCFLWENLDFMIQVVGLEGWPMLTWVFSVRVIFIISFFNFILEYLVGLEFIFNFFYRVITITWFRSLVLQDN